MYLYLYTYLTYVRTYVCTYIHTYLCTYDVRHVLCISVYYLLKVFGVRAFLAVVFPGPECRLEDAQKAKVRLDHKLLAAGKKNEELEQLSAQHQAEQIR